MDEVALVVVVVVVLGIHVNLTYTSSEEGRAENWAKEVDLPSVPRKLQVVSQSHISTIFSVLLLLRVQDLSLQTRSHLNGTQFI
ncbi:hypothetical protein HC762_00670 [bacterium]|nr:hypothetical protein [bacterium]